MDRRSFLKAFGAALAGCSVASVAEAAHPLMEGVFRGATKTHMPSMKVIGMGRSGLALMQSMQTGPETLPSHIQADYLAIRFNGRITRGILSPDLEWAVPLNYHRWREVSDDLQNVAVNRQRIPGMERELSEYVKGADIVLLLVSLDNAMSFAACDAVAKIARNSGALTVALAGVPYGQHLEDISDESLRMASHDAVNRFLGESDCVITTDGIWGAGSTIESVSWDFGYQSSVPCSLLSAAWATSMNGGNFDGLRQVLSGSGKAVHGFGLGRSAREAIKEAFERQYWLDKYGKTAVASSGVVIVSAHPKSVDARLDEVRSELARIQPLEIPQWGGKPDILLLAAPDDRLQDDKYFCVDIVSTGVEFVGEA